MAADPTSLQKDHFSLWPPGLSGTSRALWHPQERPEARDLRRKCGPGAVSGCAFYLPVPEMLLPKNAVFLRPLIRGPSYLFSGYCLPARFTHITCDPRSNQWPWSWCVTVSRRNSPWSNSRRSRHALGDDPLSVWKPSVRNWGGSILLFEASWKSSPLS